MSWILGALIMGLSNFGFSLGSLYGIYRGTIRV